MGSFAIDASKKRGRKSLCLECDRAKAKRYYAANRERVIERVLAYNQTYVPPVAPPKMCRGCGNVELVNRRHWYCSSCRPARLRVRNRRESGRYPSFHPRLRRMWARVVAMGTVNCARCGLPIGVDQEWDLGHDDHDRSKYNGPEHRFARDCPMGGNRATSRRDRQSW